VFNGCHPMAGWLITMTSDVSTGRPDVIAIAAAVHNSTYILNQRKQKNSCQYTVTDTNKWGASLGPVKWSTSVGHHITAV